MKTFKFPLKTTVVVLGLAFAQPAFAIWPVTDAAAIIVLNLINTSVIAVGASVDAMNANLGQMLYQVGTAINESTQKVSSTVEESARSTREYSTAQEHSRMLEEARQRYTVPTSICSESGSGGAAQVGASAGSAKGSTRPRGGGSIGNTQVAQAVNSPAVSPEVDAARATHVHAQYCDADDFAAYGGAQACPAVSANMPGGDKRFDSLVIGAGPNGKTPDLTFSQDQVDAALMYVQNGVRRSIGPQLHKGEADTAAGAQYIGLVTQFSALQSAAAAPLEQQIADSELSPATAPLLAEALQSPAASSYFQLTASPRARATNTMSAREFEAFEVGRRYANTAYLTDLQTMSGDNLIREQIRVAALNNWLLLNLKNETRMGNIINGLALASTARQEYEPILAQKYRAVAGRMGAH